MSRLGAMPDQLNTNKLRVEDAADAPTAPWSSVHLVGKGKLAQAHLLRETIRGQYQKSSLALLMGQHPQKPGLRPSLVSLTGGAPQRVLTFVDCLYFTHTRIARRIYRLQSTVQKCTLVQFLLFIFCSCILLLWWRVENTIP